MEFKSLKKAICEIPNYKEKVAASRLTLIHGCGIDLRNDCNVKFINDCSIRIVWSPVSNLLLYADTPDYLNSKIGTIINGNLIFGTQELFNLFGLKGNNIVSLDADMAGISADEGAKNLRVCIPKIQFTQGGETVEVHIDFADAINRLNDLFDKFNSKGKKFVRNRLLSSYDLPYQKQITRLKREFNIG